MQKLSARGRHHSAAGRVPLSADARYDDVRRPAVGVGLVAAQVVPRAVRAAARRAHVPHDAACGALADRHPLGRRRPRAHFARRCRVRQP